MPKKIYYVYLFLTISGLLSLLISCAQPEPAVQPATIVPNIPATPLDSVDLSKYTSVQSEPDPDGAQLFEVGFGADGVYIAVSYTAPPELAAKWIQGDIFVVDEKSGTVFNQTALVPVIGWLFQRPMEQGQYASVMLVNSYHGFQIKSGAVVTVVLGKYKREHVTVK
jgi:hypothetical protein